MSHREVQDDIGRHILRSRGATLCARDLGHALVNANLQTLVLVDMPNANGHGHVRLGSRAGRNTPSYRNLLATDLSCFGRFAMPQSRYNFRKQLNGKRMSILQSPKIAHIHTIVTPFYENAPETVVCLIGNLIGKGMFEYVVPPMFEDTIYLMCPPPQPKHRSDRALAARWTIYKVVGNHKAVGRVGGHVWESCIKHNFAEAFARMAHRPAGRCSRKSPLRPDPKLGRRHTPPPLRNRL